jgi:hypothetical protein
MMQAGTSQRGCPVPLKPTIFIVLVCQVHASWLHRTSDGGAYLNLPSGGVNWSEYYPLKSDWFKIRILEVGLTIGSQNVTVDLTDSTFADHNNNTSFHHDKTEYKWGGAADCRGGAAESAFSLNLKGTPFGLERSLYSDDVGHGSSPTGGFSCADRQRQACTGSCGGRCGWCGFGFHSSYATLIVVNQMM